MKSLIAISRVLTIVLMFTLTLVFISCGDDDGDDPLPPTPRIALSSEAASLERGQNVTVELTLTAEGGFQSLTVNGDDLAYTVDPSDATSATASFPIVVAEDAAFESTEYVFTVTDNRNQDADATFTLTVIGSTIDLSGTDITENATFEAQNIYLFDTLEIINGATLTIPAGTRLYAKSAFGTANDIFSEFKVDDGQLIVQGTSDNPVVFSSENALNNQGAAGDWIGLRINGTDGASSGSIEYARIEFGGEDNAAFRMDEVDQATTVDYVQIYRSGGIGFEARAGSVDVSHLVITEAGLSSIDLDDTGGAGYAGDLQFVIIQSSEALVKQNSGGDDQRDFEARDGATFNISNMTIVGSGRDVAGGSLNALRMRNDVGNFKIYNSIIAEYSNDGFRQDDTGNITDIDGLNVFAHSYIFQILDDATRDDSDPDNLPLPYETDAGFVNVIDGANTPTAAAGIGVGDYVPDATITSTFDPTTINSFFQAGSYVGAVGATDWTLGWTLNADGSVRQ